jgi:hypothetical protein
MARLLEGHPPDEWVRRQTIIDLVALPSAIAGTRSHRRSANRRCD